MARFLVDSDLIISYTKHHPEALTLLAEVMSQEETALSAISAVTTFEVLQGLRYPEQPAVRRLFSAFRCLPVTEDIARVGAKLVREQRKQGSQLTMGDALIAATVLLHDLVLVTGNKKHFDALGVRLYGDVSSGGATQQER